LSRAERAAGASLAAWPAEDGRERLLVSLLAPSIVRTCIARIIARRNPAVVRLGQTEKAVGNLKKLGGLLLCLLIAGASLSMAVDAWYQLAATGELPIHARRGSGTVEPFTFSYFVVAAFYALVVVIGATAIIGLIDQYIPIAENYRPRIRRILALLAAVSFVVPIVISVARGSTAN
jgi:hypothetical protein